MRGVISAKESDAAALVERARTLPSMEGMDLTGAVTTREPYRWRSDETEPLTAPPLRVAAKPLRVAALDFGIKRNILRRLERYGCEVTVFPASAEAATLRDFRPDGLFLSNGPGDPAAVAHAIETIRSLAREVPIFGICLGHQLLALAFGAKTYKMKFGHRGANHPIKNLLTGKVEITSQNHGFAVEAASMPDELELTHINLNDNTVAGFRHKRYPIFCVQYHPEASPGTHDSDYLFERFIEAMTARKSAIRSATLTAAAP